MGLKATVTWLIRMEGVMVSLELEWKLALNIFGNIKNALKRKAGTLRMEFGQHGHFKLITN